MFFLNLNSEKINIHFHFVLGFYDVASYNGHEKEVVMSQRNLKTLLNSSMNQWNKRFDVLYYIFRAVF